MRPRPRPAEFRQTSKVNTKSEQGGKHTNKDCFFVYRKRKKNKRVESHWRGICLRFLGRVVLMDSGFCPPPSRCSGFLHRSWSSGLHSRLSFTHFKGRNCPLKNNCCGVVLPRASVRRISSKSAHYLGGFHHVTPLLGAVDLCRRCHPTVPSPAAQVLRKL